MNLLVSLFSSSYEELWKAIIRPYRDEYTLRDLGPSKFRLNQKYYKRTDFSIMNNPSFFFIIINGAMNST